MSWLRLLENSSPTSEAGFVKSFDVKSAQTFGHASAGTKSRAERNTVKQFLAKQNHENKKAYHGFGYLLYYDLLYTNNKYYFD